MNDKIINTVDYLFKNYWNYENIPLFVPSETKIFCILGKDKEIFVECVSRFTSIHCIDSCELIRNMSKIVDLHESNEFLDKLETLVHKYTNYIDQYITMNLVPDYLNFILINNEKLLKKQPYKSFNKILIYTPVDNIKEKYDHIIINNEMKFIIYKALEFIRIYCDKKD